jgi:hypothetical protein
MSHRIGRTVTAKTQRGRIVTGKLVERRESVHGSVFLVLQPKGTTRTVCVRPSAVYPI